MSKKILSNRFSNGNDLNGNRIKTKAELKMKVTKTKNRRPIINDQQNFPEKDINVIDNFCNVQSITYLRDKFKDFVKNETEKKSNELKQGFLLKHQQKANELQNEMKAFKDKTDAQTNALIESYYKQKEIYENWQKVSAEQKKITEEFQHAIQINRTNITEDLMNCNQNVEN